MAGPAPEIHQHLRLWWRRSAARHRALAVVGAASVIFVLVLTLSSPVRESAVKYLPLDLVGLTLLSNATERGALCLDGSIPGYHLQRGFGSGEKNWVLHIEGGGWCNSVKSCSFRRGTPLGSSHFMEREIFLHGILSHDQSQNPDFYNWNRVKIRYCDGGSFSGDVEIQVQNGRKLIFRGQRIWEAIMDELLSKGLENAKQAFLTGCSAGGLATFIHCDSFRALMPKETVVKCLADAGFFLDEKDISGKRTMQSFYNEVVHLQDIGKNLPKDCISRLEPSEASLLFVYLSSRTCQEHKDPIFYS
ncbi:pectin acetylesterase 5-like isoform X1 [Iris pallida]|uniref:Pectin acetylesterase n=1 Tax=Iris pallida TaxID=29817 RepID=A0AAX6ERT3_IRIPA|nr:pectin acetylesterase 5-like isoform X1 [Iris pallida]